MIFFIIVYLYRQLEAADRPTACDVNVSLQKPEFKLLLWKSEELSKESTKLGAPLSAGKELYLDLQNTYKYITWDEMDCRKSWSNLEKRITKNINLT